ncbi:MAG TPA: GNAT family N-acetyltransferase [Thermoanaerobacterales bacterium]|nr:GNAT family N-acetyltransferase [Thermoanaerobacterales bacterium]
MKIEGKKINLRNVNVSDFSKIIQWHQNQLLTYLTGKKLPKNIEECNKRYLKKSLLHHILAIEDKNGNFLGEIEIRHIRWKEKIAELFIYIGEENLWGKGYGTEALSVFIDYIFNIKGFKTIYLRVYENNKRAIKCYEKCGFKKKGILRFKNQHDNLILMETTADAIKK